MQGELLAGKVAIVTGGGRGLGRGLALALGAAGADVVVAGRSADALAATVAELTRRGGSGLAVTMDVTVADDVDRLVQTTVNTFGTVDILVNNAQGPHGHGRLLDVTDEQFETGFQSGPLAAFRLMRACHPHLRGGGVVVNLGTGASLRSDPATYALYGAVKEATRFLSRVAAVEWAADGIRVHTIIPLAETDALSSWAKAMPDDAESFRRSIPLGRWGDPETDIGRAVVFLCGPDSGYITGGTILIDGGQAFLR
jgi:NAD(P)-dependent dehydrogenase (short-subunit alcohol dehydrogenase family)